MIYKDLKASHVFINAKGEVTLIDFGLAEQVSEDKCTYKAGGTLHAMSPQMLSLYLKQSQNVKSLDSVSANTDLYSLGVLLLEIIQSSKIHYVHKAHESKLNQYSKLRDISPY